MDYIELVFIAVGLAMDAFAAAVCKGMSLRRPSAGQCLTVGLFFGGFQALMPVLGWLLGRQFEALISSFDHWVAFALLTLIGGHMIWDALRAKPKEENEAQPKLNLRELLVLSVATSIDALAVGVTFALMPGTDIRLSALLIGVITFALSAFGVFLGSRAGAKWESKATLGGVILILIGIKTIIEHTFHL